MKIEDQIEYIKTHLNQPITIIGMMGAGKTTLGRRISEIFKWEFFDSDLVIEEEEGISIQEMFQTKGESYFRAKEKAKIAQLLEQQVCILSVGGGAITAPETAAHILAESLCIWIDAPIHVLASRVSHQGTRPLLNGKDPKQALSERMEQRKHLYEQAHIHVDGSRGIDTVAQNAIGQIYEYLLQKSDEV